DGIELNGILFHRFDWAAGWVASSSATGLSAPNVEDAYVHVGIKSGGVALDGEGKYGPNVPDPAKPWAEKAITADAFAYHGLDVLDNGTGVAVGSTASPIAQRNSIDAVGGTIRAQYDSLTLDSGLQYEYHTRPYVGTAATTLANGASFPGVPDYTNAKAVVQWNELSYVVFPWLVPAIRTEFTRATYEASNPVSLLRIVPGVAMLIRPDVRLIVTGDFERAYGVPAAGSWDAAGGAVVAPGAGRASMFEAEQITATAAVAF
ncbi:MAG: hypothetical protein ACRELY_26330, partial [Polyangiaceae bacterium]